MIRTAREKECSTGTLRILYCTELWLKGTQHFSQESKDQHLEAARKKSAFPAWCRVSSAPPTGHFEYLVHELSRSAVFSLFHDIWCTKSVKDGGSLALQRVCQTFGDFLGAGGGGGVRTPAPQNQRRGGWERGRFRTARAQRQLLR